MSAPSMERPEIERMVQFLARGGATPRRADALGKVVLDAGEGRALTVSADSLAALARRGLAERRGTVVELSTVGKALARRLLSENPFLDQHRRLESVSIKLPEGYAQATVNMNESPLAQLVRRRTKSGEAFLTEREFQAGERLRSDYTRGNIMPRLGANWVAAVSSGRRGSGGAQADLTDAMIAARRRVEKAVASVGPELSGVLIDVCCFLKGIETVEAERRWPSRSAKLMLKAALGVLSRHYEPPRQSASAGMLRWGAEDYRPSMCG